MIDALFLPYSPDQIDIAGLIHIGRSQTLGALYNNDGVPAAALGMPGVIQGHVYRMDQDNRIEILTQIDGLFGIPGSPYLRSIAMTGFGAAYAWHWTGSLELPAIASGEWPSDKA